MGQPPTVLPVVKSAALTNTRRPCEHSTGKPRPTHVMPSLGAVSSCLNTLPQGWHFLRLVAHPSRISPLRARDSKTLIRCSVARNPRPLVRTSEAMIISASSPWKLQYNKKSGRKGKKCQESEKKRKEYRLSVAIQNQRQGLRLRYTHNTTTPDSLHQNKQMKEQIKGKMSLTCRPWQCVSLPARS